MGDVQRRYSSIPYGWKEIDIAALIARLVARQKVSIRYGGATIKKMTDVSRTTLEKEAKLIKR